MARLNRKSKAAIDEFRRSLIDLAVGSRLEGVAPLYLFRVHTRQDLARVLPKTDLGTYGLGGSIAEMLVAARLPSALKLSYDLSRHAFEWWVAIHPSLDWASARKAIAEDLARPSYEQRFGLSYDAARLLEWIDSRKPDEMLGNWTPVVEPRIESEIGFTNDWPTENIAALIQMLVDEINAKTGYELSLQPWKEHGEVHTRIKVAKREPIAASSLRDSLAKLSVNHGLDLSPETLEQVLRILKESRKAP
mgnify:CR=1 FL=1